MGWSDQIDLELGVPCELALSIQVFDVESYGNDLFKTTDLNTTRIVGSLSLFHCHYKTKFRYPNLRHI